MNQVLTGGIALIIALVLWSSKKQFKTKTFLSRQNNSNSISFETTTLVKEKKFKEKQAKREHGFEYPLVKQVNQALNAKETYQELTKLFSRGPNERLYAIEIARKWKNPKAIKFLKRGLKDFDSRVVVAAATAISESKGKTNGLREKTQEDRPPRNVSLMR